MARYLCYDVKGIQAYIFAVPRLQYVIGGSALVAELDERVPRLELAAEHVYSGAGKGAFLCHDAQQEQRAKEAILAACHERGLDVAFGVGDDFSAAANEAIDLHPFFPESMAGEPCAASACYPVPRGTGRGYAEDAKGVHPIIWRRIWESDTDRVRDRLGDSLLDKLTPRLPPDMVGARFFESVTADPSDPSWARHDARRGSAALGNRNRWALICMDGNDLGAQLRVAAGRYGSSGDLAGWIRRMSKELHECTVEACVAGMAVVVQRWQAAHPHAGDADDVVLPLRPIVVGGDDIIVLCHAEHAFAFVREACAAFERQSRDAHDKSDGLWHATGGSLSISAGVLFAPVTYPLHAAVDFAEALLASAKHHGRRRQREGDPAPACVDWESVTDGLLDSPAERRRRELIFVDGDLDGDQTVELTRRPYTLVDLEDTERLAEDLARVPVGVRHQVLRGMRAGFWDRCLLAARLGKRHLRLVEALEENESLAELAKSKASRWQADVSERRRSTDVIDALLLLEERARMTWETAHDDD